jgi:hypothetical protein
MTTSPIPLRPSARDLWYTGSGQSVPSPTDDEIVAVLRNGIAKLFDRSTLDKPEARAMLFSTARAIRALFPEPTTNATSKDTV